MTEMLLSARGQSSAGGYVHQMLTRRVLLAVAITSPLCPTVLLAQGATVAGRTVDSTSRAPIAAVTVVLVNTASGDTLSGTLTGAHGRFLLRGLSASWPLRNQRGDVTLTFTDMLADFGIRREFDGQGFTALYENLKETQTARVRLRVRF